MSLPTTWTLKRLVLWRTRLRNSLAVLWSFLTTVGSWTAPVPTSWRGKATLKKASGTGSSALGIAEPTGKTYDSSVLASLDVLFIPALAIDNNGMRLGKGAGYYDRALASLNPRPRTIAIVYAEEVLDAVPHDDHDQAVDLVITD